MMLFGIKVLDLSFFVLSIGFADPVFEVFIAGIGKVAIGVS